MQKIDLFLDNTDSFHHNLVDPKMPTVSQSIANKIIDTRYFEVRFSLFKNEPDKPLAIYVVNAEGDKNGAVLSVKGLQIANYQCRKYSKDYNIKGIVSCSNEDLNEKLSSLNQDISVLHIRGHGQFIRRWANAKLNNISTNTQILLEACTTFDIAKPEESIAYKIAQSNNCEVFAVPCKINFAQPVIKVDHYNQPKIKSLGAFSASAQPIKSFRLYCKNQVSHSNINISI